MNILCGHTHSHIVEMIHVGPGLFKKSARGLKKAWLEDFYAFVESQGGTTAEVMGHILKMEADFRVLLVTMNALNTSLSNESSLQDRNATRNRDVGRWRRGVVEVQGPKSDRKEVFRGSEWSDLRLYIPTSGISTPRAPRSCVRSSMIPP